MVLFILLGQVVQSGSFVLETSTGEIKVVSSTKDESRLFPPAQEVLQNPGFETGVLSPWYQASGNHWVITTDYPHSGRYCATDTGNYWIRQDFAQPIPAESVISITIWSRQAPDKPSYLQAFDLMYSDLTYHEDVVFPDTSWQQWDITSWLTQGKELSGLRIWGFNSSDPADDSTYIDDISIIANMPLVIEEDFGLPMTTLSAWPSAFSSSCRVDLHTSQPGRLLLYNSSGAMLKELWHGQGAATVQFGCDLVPGVYILRLDGGQNRLCKIVIKR